MSDTGHDEPDDELELAPETVEDLDADDDEAVKGGAPRDTERYICN